MRVHDSQAYRKMDVTRERISRILELREILLSFQTGLNLVNVAVVCAVLEMGYMTQQIFMAAGGGALAFSSHARILEEGSTNQFPACAFFIFFFLSGDHLVHSSSTLQAGSVRWLCELR